METTPSNPFSRMTSRLQMRCLKIAAVAAVAAAGLVAQPSDSVAQTRPQELAANTRVIIDYIDPRMQRSQATLDRLRKRQVLEELSLFLSPLRLPRVLRIRTKSCGVVNAFYVPGEWAINLCYEFYENLEAIAPQGDLAARLHPRRGDRRRVHRRDLPRAGSRAVRHPEFPVFGREEDAADQLSAFLMLQFGKDVARTTIRGAASPIWRRRIRARAPTSPTSTARRRSGSSTTSASPMAASRTRSASMSTAACCRRRGPTSVRANMGWCAARSLRPSCRISTWN